MTPPSPQADGRRRRTRRRAATVPASGAERERTREHRRARLHAAVLGVACERGVQGTTVARVIGRAGVARSTFYEHTRGAPELLAAALDELLLEGAAQVAAASYGHEEWTEAMRAALGTALGLLDTDRDLARLVVVEFPALAPGAAAHRDQLLERIAEAIDGGRAGAPRQPPEPAARGVLGGVLGAIHCELLDPDGRPLIELLGPLMSFIVLPYRGSDASRSELDGVCERARC